MDFNFKPTTALIFTGQFRLQENQTPLEKIQKQLELFSHDEVYMFVWDYEYQEHKTQLDKLNAHIIIGDSKQPFFDDETMQYLVLQFRNYFIRKMIKDNEKDTKRDHIEKILFKWTKHYYIIQRTFQEVNLKHTFYIKTRYDNIYLGDAQLDELKSFLDNPKPCISTPLYGDADGIGLGDLFVMTNKNGAKIFQTYLEQIIEEVKKNLCPPSPEAALRYIFANKHDADVYRINLPCTTEEMVKRNFWLHGNTPFKYIRQDKLKVPITHAPENVDVTFDLQLFQTQ